MNNELSKQDLRQMYKAAIKALIVFYGLKHTHVAALLGMRDDTFSRWFRSDSRSLSAEEMKLFCDGLKIPSSVIEILLEHTISFRQGDGSMEYYISNFSRSSDAEKLATFFGEQGRFKIMLLIQDFLPKKALSN
ncbi:MAG: hypothetical protein K0S32_4190 [Bacteroidetes bacterium]|jgi:hypothetical protein|nr:hypothetical protein [Bacteroidota bacterium]